MDLFFALIRILGFLIGVCYIAETAYVLCTAYAARVACYGSGSEEAAARKSRPLAEGYPIMQA